MKLDITLQDLNLLQQVLVKQMEVEVYCGKDITKHANVLNKIIMKIRTEAVK